MDFELAWEGRPAAWPGGQGSAAGPAGFLRLELGRIIAAQHQRWPLWVPVALAAGAALYFALPVEPHWTLALLAGSLVLAIIARIRRGLCRPAWLLVAACAAGFVAAKARTLWLDTAVLAAPTGDVVMTGRIVGLAPVGERSLRLDLDEVKLEGIKPQHAPRRVEIRIAAPTRPSALQRGATIRVHALLSPLPGP